MLINRRTTGDQLTVQPSAIDRFLSRFSFAFDVRNLFSIISPSQKKWLLLLLSAMVVQAIIQLVFVGSLPLAVRILQNPGQAENIQIYKWANQFLKIPDDRTMTFALSIVAAGFVITVVGTMFLAIFRSAILRAFINDISERLFAAYLSAPYQFHLRHNSAELIRSLHTEVKWASNSFMAVLQIIMSFITILAICSLLFIKEPLIAFCVLVGTGFGAYFIVVILRGKSRRLGKQQRKEEARIITIINHALHGIRETRVLGRESTFFSEYSQSIRTLSSTAHQHEKIKAFIQPGLRTIAILMLLIASGMLYLQHGSLESILPSLALFLGGFWRIMPAIKAGITSLSTLYFRSPSATSVADHLYRLRGAHALSPVTFDENVEPYYFREELTVEEVGFTYPDHHSPVLANVSLRVRKGEMIGFVGTTGSGKSTMVDILLGMLKPDNGRVLLDGSPVQTGTAGWYVLFSVVPQSVFMLDGTIRSNVAFGVRDSEVDDKRVWWCLEQALLADKVRHLSRRLDARVGENGIFLSGGERQRLGLARALYNNPTVLVLDEATSALDGHTESLVIENISRFRQNMTCVVVAHRLQTIEDCDRIYVFSGGRIVASGTYEQLIQDSPEFRKIAQRR